MQREEELRLLRILQDGIDNGTSADAGGIMKAPVTDFTCPDLLAQEQQVFFRTTPLFLGLSSDLPAPNSYYATSETGQPILMTRDDQGQFRAFLNVCRHRGVQVVPDGKGDRNRFTCPFHAWTYKNSGELIAINRERNFGCIDKGEHGLTELPSQEHRGMLWVRPSPGERFDIDKTLGGLGPEMEAWNLNDYTPVGDQVIRADINWKLAIDTFGENYHFDVLHRDSLAPEIFGNLQTHDVFDLNYRMVFATRAGWKYIEDNGLPQEQWPFKYITLNVYFIFPNVIFLPDANGIHLLRMYPDDNQPGRSRTHHSRYLSSAARQAMQERGDEDQAMAADFTDFNRIIIDEDYAVAASTQRSALSGAQTHFTFGRNEPALHHYHNAHRRGLGLPDLELII